MSCFVGTVRGDRPPGSGQEADPTGEGVQPGIEGGGLAGWGPGQGVEGSSHLAMGGPAGIVRGWAGEGQTGHLCV